MFGRDPVDEDTKDWIVDGFHWAVEAGFLTPDTPLVQATPEFFPARAGQSEEDTVKALVDDLKRLWSLENHRINVVPIAVLPDELRHSYQSMGEVAGTWSADHNSATLRYDPTLIRKPVMLLSVLAHELMHERLSWASSSPPGGPAAEELNTDLHCITSGFGVIQIAGSEAAGWQGYMRQESRAWALALFLRVRGIDLDQASAGLTPRAFRLLRRAVKSVDHEDQTVADIQSAIAEQR